MSTANERLKQRLLEVPGDVIIEILLRLTKGNPALKRELVALTTDAQAKTKSIRKMIAGLERSMPVLDTRDNRSEKKLRIKLEDILFQIDHLGKKSPAQAFELLCEFVCTDSFVIGHGDNPIGVIPFLYRFRAPALATTIVARFNDDAHTSTCLRIVLDDDPVGIRCQFVQAVGSFAPEAVMHDAFEFVVRRVLNEKRGDLHDTRPLADVLRSIVVALGDVEQYISLFTYQGALSTRDTVTLAQMYADHERYDEAQRCIDALHRISFANNQTYDVQSAINSAVGRTAPPPSYFITRFHSKPDVKSYRAMADHIDAAELKSVMDAFEQEVASAPKLLQSTLKVLIADGRGEQAEALVVKRSEYLNAEPNVWPRIAEAFRESGLHFGAAVTYRIIITGILEYNRTPYSAFAYYEWLWAIGVTITDWHGLPDHDTFIAELFKRYADRSNFWWHAEYSNKPPKKSRFAVRSKD